MGGGSCRSGEEEGKGKRDDPGDPRGFCGLPKGSNRANCVSVLSFLIIFPQFGREMSRPTGLVFYWAGPWRAKAGRKRCYGTQIFKFRHKNDDFIKPTMRVMFFGFFFLFAVDAFKSIKADILKR